MCETVAFECMTGNISLDIAERISKIDPVIGQYGPTFWTFSYWAHLSQAQMCAIKLFDSHDAAITVPFLLRQCCELKEKFQAKPEEVVKFVYEAAQMIVSLEDAIEILRRRRNNHLAHISRTQTYQRERLMEGPKLEVEEIRHVLTEGGRIVRRAQRLYCDKAEPITDSRSADIKDVIKLMCKQINAEADKEEAEAAQRNYPLTVPRPDFKCDG
jgi:hypothetical protein